MFKPLRPVPSLSSATSLGDASVRLGGTQPSGYDAATVKVEREVGVQPITPTLIATMRRQRLGGRLLDNGALKYVGFLDPVRVTPILRTSEEPITTTVGRQAGAVVVNGYDYDLSFMGKVDAELGRPDPADDTPVEGEVVSSGKTIASDSRPQRFYLAEVVNKMQRKPKDPPLRFTMGLANPRQAQA